MRPNRTEKSKSSKVAKVKTCDKLQDEAAASNTGKPLSVEGNIKAAPHLESPSPAVAREHVQVAHLTTISITNPVWLPGSERDESEPQLPSAPFLRIHHFFPFKRRPELLLPPGQVTHGHRSPSPVSPHRSPSSSSPSPCPLLERQISLQGERSGV